MTLDELSDGDEFAGSARSPRATSAASPANRTLTTDWEDHYAAVRGKRRDLPDDGPEYWAYWEARIDEAREGL